MAAQGGRGVVATIIWTTAPHTRIGSASMIEVIVTDLGAA
jgi:hypothetical protein